MSKSSSNSYAKLLALASNVRSGLRRPESVAYKSKAHLYAPKPEQDVSSLERDIYNTPEGRASAAMTSKGGGEPRRNVLNMVLDALSVGSYASANQAKEVIDNSRKLSAAKKQYEKDGNLAKYYERHGLNFLDTINVFDNIGAGLKQGFSNSEKDTYSDVLKELGWKGESKGDKVGRAVSGFVGDVALDPLTYLSLGAVPGVKTALKGGGKAAKAISKAGGGVKASRDVKIAPTGEVATEGNLDVVSQILKSREKESAKHVIPQKISGNVPLPKNIQGTVPDSVAPSFEDLFKAPERVKLNPKQKQRYNELKQKKNRLPGEQLELERLAKTGGANPARVFDATELYDSKYPVSVSSAGASTAVVHAGTRPADDVTDLDILEAARKNPMTPVDDGVPGSLPTPRAKSDSDIVETAHELYTGRIANPALRGRQNVAEFTKNVENGTYTDEMLKPFYQHYGVSGRDDLLAKVPGSFSKALPAVRKDYREAMKNRLAPDIARGGSPAENALRLAANGQEEAALSGTLLSFKSERVVKFDNELVEKTFNETAERILRDNVVRPASYGKAGGKNKSPHVYNRDAKGKTVTALGQNNLQDQTTAFSKMSSALYSKLVKSGTDPIIARNTVIAAMKRYEDLASAKGMPPHLDPTSKAEGIPLSVSDVLMTLKPSLIDEHVIGNYANTLQMKTILTGVHDALTLPTMSRGQLIESIVRSMREVDGGTSNALKTSINLKGKEVPNKKFNERVLEEFAEDIVDKMPQWMQAIRFNSNKQSVEFGTKVAGLSAAAAKGIGTSLDAGRQGEAIEQILGLDTNLKKAAKDIGLIGPAELYVAAAKSQVGEKIPELADPAVLSRIVDSGKTADVVEDAYKGIDLPEPTSPAAKEAQPTILSKADDIAITAQAAKVDEVKEATDIAKSMVEKPTTPATADEIGDHLMEAGSKASLNLWDSLGRMFNGTHGMGKGAALFHQGIDSRRAIDAQFIDLVGQMSQTYSKTQMKEMFDAFRRGEDVADSTFSKMLETTFDSNKYSAMRRAGMTDEKMIYHYEKAGVPDEWIPTVSKMGDFKNYDFPDDFDVADYMNKVFMAKTEAIAFSSIANQFSNLFGTVSKVRPGPEYFKPSFGKGGIDAHQLGMYIDTSRWYHKDTLDGLSEMNRFLKDLDGMYDYKHSGFNTLMNKVIKPVTSKWKLWNTVVRPGHHVKNQIGDMMLTYLALGARYSGVREYSDALRVLRVHNKDYKGIDGLMERLSEDAFGIKDSVKGGRRRYGNIELSDEMIFRSAKQENLMPDFYTVEDLQMGTRGTDMVSGFAQTRNPVGKALGKVEKVGGAVSELRDKHVRLAHYMGAIRKISKENPKWTPEKVMGVAAADVRRWHPNGTGLSVFENKYMKQGIMFYSWNRLTLPLMAEAFLTRPGRVMVAPKAMYAIAEANGIDLDHGFGNPFPTDQIYPDFLTDDLYGPVAETEDGKQIGIKPGLPQLDTLNDMGTPGRFADTALSSVNPLVRVPVEFATGKKFGATENRDITDKSEYIDQQIPLASYVNNMTGRSLSSGFTQETKKEKADARGDSPVKDSIINLLLGMGATDYTSDRYQEWAKRDQKARLKEEAERNN